MSPVSCLLAGFLALALPAGAAQARSGGRPVDARFTLDISGPPGGEVKAMSQIVLSVPPGVKAAGAGLASCTAETIHARGDTACPKKSHVGGGKAAGRAIGLVEQLRMELFNAPGGKALLLHPTGSQPLQINMVIPGKLSRPGGRYGMSMDFALPENLLHPLQGVTAALTHLDVGITGASGWLRATSCPSRPWSVNSAIGFEDGSALTTGADLRCL
jgi:hypothetical protein